MISRRPERVGTSKWIERSNRPGRSNAGSRSAARLVAPITRMFENTGGFFFKRRCAGSQRLAQSIEARLHAPAARRLVERLELDQQLVHDAGDAFARRAALDLRVAVQHVVERRAAHAAAGAGDRVDLLDEADRAALFARRLAQLLEVVADLAAGLAVVHRLERGGRHEQVGHARFPRHRLGHVGLAGARRTFEEDRLARVAAHVLAERLVAEEQVERVDDLLAHRPDADDVVHRDVDLARVVPNVRRLPGRHHRHDDHDAEQRDQPERQEDLHLPRRQAREAEADRVRGADPVVEVHADRREPDEELPEAAPAGALPAAGDVDARAPDDGAVGEVAEVHVARLDRLGGTPVGGCESRLPGRRRAWRFRPRRLR